MAAGSLVTALLVVGLAIPPNLWLFAACVIAIEVVGVTLLYDAAFGPTEPRCAITHLTLIAGFDSTIFWPLRGSLVGLLGCRSTYATFATLHLLIALPLHAWIAARPRKDSVTGTGRQTRHDFGAPLAGGVTRLAF